MRNKKKSSKKVSRKKVKKTGVGMGKNIITFPAKLLSPVGNFLRLRLKKLKRRKKVIAKEDPFRDISRITDNASPDADAAEQFGHARVTAIKAQLDKKIIQTRKALARVRLGKYGTCEDCRRMINTDRLVVYPEATLCAKCQEKREK
jgi:RNA polymerase-binding transcription factor DksA